MSQKNKKTAYIKNQPQAGKYVKAAQIPKDDLFPEFRAEQLDLDGPYGWHKFNPLELGVVLTKIFVAQKLTWQEHRANGSHLVEVHKIITPMQKRLKELRKEDLDLLFSFRITGPKRIWGIKENNLLWLLWWDPKHEICPSLLKNT